MHEIQSFNMVEVYIL